MKLIDNASGLADYTAATFLRNPFERQIVLSSIDVPTRLNRVAAFLAAEIDLKKLSLASAWPSGLKLDDADGADVRIGLKFGEALSRGDAVDVQGG